MFQVTERPKEVFSNKNSSCGAAQKHDDGPFNKH